MDALSRGGWVHALSSCVWMDALCRGGWMDALNSSG